MLAWGKSHHDDGIQLPFSMHRAPITAQHCYSYHTSYVDADSAFVRILYTRQTNRTRVNCGGISEMAFLFICSCVVFIPSPPRPPRCHAVRQVRATFVRGRADVRARVFDRTG